MSSDITYLSVIVEALKDLDGMGSLKEINDRIQKNDKLEQIHTNPNWQASVRAAIQRHCSESKTYSGQGDLFYSVYGLGEGYWGLRDSSDTNDTGDNPIIRRQIRELSNSDIEITEREMIVKARIGQGYFRDSLIEKYGSCIITGISDPRLLIASHIKPWRSSNNYERLSAENGLLLSPLFDKLFDNGLISFDKNMKIIISDSLTQTDVDLMGIDTDTVYIRNPSDELQLNMAYHREKIFRNHRN